ncbi:hypothetical protein ACWFMI_01380 [Nocardiopsis terrae]
MTPADSSARRLVAGGTLFLALGALGVASAVPAGATRLLWADAQAWAADGDLVAGYSTAVSVGGETEDDAGAERLLGPLAEYAQVEGESRTLVNARGALSEAVVEQAAVRLGVNDLIDLGMIDLAGEVGEPPAGAPEEEPRGSGPQDGPAERTPREREPKRESQQAEEPLPRTPPQIPTQGPTDTPGEDVVILGEEDSETVSADGNAVEFTLTDVRASSAAAYGGETEASLEHGELTAFGEPVADFDGDHLSEETLEVLDEEGGTLTEVPVSVRFLANEDVFDDEEDAWDGKGVQSSLTVWVQVGDPELENGFVVDFADTRAVGSTHGSATPPGTDGLDEGRQEVTAPSKRLATSGGSLAALVAAAVVAVGGGAAATFLARKRTTAMDDRIED